MKGIDNDDETTNYRTTKKYKADSYDDLEIYSKMAKELHKKALDKKDKNV